MTRLLALAMSGLILVACVSRVPPTSLPTVGPSPAGSASPSTAGPDDVLLRMIVGGGLRYPGATFEAPPLFTLYGDGRVIYSTPVDAPPDASGRLDLRQAQLTAEQLAALVAFAVDEGGLALARERYDGVPIADALTTWFEVNVDGLNKTVAVYALDYSEDPVGDAEVRTRLRALAAQLDRFADTVRSGEVESLGAFEPGAYLVTLDRPFGPMIDGPAANWPWNDLAPSDFVQMNGGQGRR